MTQGVFSVSILLAAFGLMFLGYLIPQIRMIMVSIGFYTLLSGVFASYSNWLPQTRGEVPPVEKLEGLDGMSAEKIAEVGSKIIFGDAGLGQGNIGKGQCPLCHGFSKGELSERAPNLFGIPARSSERVASDVYKTQKTIQAEAFSGSGRATNAIEYVAESHACPNCFVVPGFGVKGSNDTESPMPTVHKAPINLTLDEMIAVDTWMFFREGGEVPSVGEIRKAYEKFIPETERQKAAPKEAGGESPPAPAGPPVALASDTPQQMITKMACIACHKIPTIPGATFGAVGPMLVEGTTAKQRVASPEYQARLKAGKAHARTPKEYVMESIVCPNCFIVPGFVNKANPEVSAMMQDFGQKFTYGALEKLAEFLLTLDEKAAIKEGMLKAENEIGAEKHADAQDQNPNVQTVAARPVGR